jgi:hypothetical protein
VIAAFIQAAKRENKEHLFGEIQGQAADEVIK